MGFVSLDERRVFTFAVPAERGHYYVAVLAEDEDEAGERILKSSQIRDVEERSGLSTPTGEGLVSISVLGSVDELVIDDAFKKRLRRFGLAHKFVPRKLASYSRRAGHHGFLPG